MRKVRGSLSLVAGTVAIALACAKAPEAGDDPTGSVTSARSLVGPRWRLVELEGQPAIAMTGSREPHLIFSRSDTAARVGGATGCNSMGGSYQADGTGLRFSGLFSTKMACVEEDRMRQESAFLNALNAVDRYAVSGDTLMLSAGDRVVAKFVKS
jgi:heat shock protein HslJ